MTCSSRQAANKSENSTIQRRRSLSRPSDLAVRPRWSIPVWGQRMRRSRPIRSFNPTTTLRFDLPREERVMLAIYDITGRRVALLADGRFGPGSFERTWRGVDDAGRSVGSGVYSFVARRKAN